MDTFQRGDRWDPTSQVHFEMTGLHLLGIDDYRTKLKFEVVRNILDCQQFAPRQHSDFGVRTVKLG